MSHDQRCNHAHTAVQQHGEHCNQHTRWRAAGTMALSSIAACFVRSTIEAASVSIRFMRPDYRPFLPIACKQVRIDWRENNARKRQE